MSIWLSKTFPVLMVVALIKKQTIESLKIIVNFKMEKKASFAIDGNNYSSDKKKE